jgi:hypothetical protein
MRGSELYRDWYEQVIMPPENDFIVCVSASSRTPVSGTGKTTLGVGLAKSLDRSESGFNADEQATLSADEFANTVIPEAEHQSAVLMDESQGTPGGGSGMNRMRAMSQSTMDAIGSLLANRDKSLTVVVIVQQIHMLFTDFFPMIDAWLLISKAPGQMGGPELKHHKVYTEDYPDAGGGLRTPVVEYLSWPSVPESDPAYQELEEMKQAAKTKGGGDGDEEDDELTPGEQLRWVRAARRQIPNAYENGPVAWSNVVDEVEQRWGVELPHSGEHYRQELKDEEIDEWSPDDEAENENETEAAAAD